jgi:TatD DNase family protein
MKFVDAHIHLSDPGYDQRVSHVIEEAKRSNVVALVSNSMNLETCVVNVQLAEENTGLVYAALGIHPWSVKNLTQEELQRTLDFISQHGADHEKVVAVGETGLDPQYAKRREVKDLQVKVFHEMLHAAERLSLPVVVHSRWSAPKIMTILPSYNLKGVLFHWFSSPVELLPQMIERGYYVSEGPPAVFSSRTQDVVKRVPITNLLTETDGPVSYYGPFKDKLTSPAFIPQVAKAVAEIKGMQENDVAKQVMENFVNFFGIEKLRLRVSSRNLEP